MQLSFETGKVGRQASGAVMARDGETVVYSTACTDRVSEEGASRHTASRGLKRRVRNGHDLRRCAQSSQLLSCRLCGVSDPVVCGVCEGCLDFVSACPARV